MPTDLQSVSFNHSDTCPYFVVWPDCLRSRRQDSNLRPAVYKTAALPLSYTGPKQAFVAWTTAQIIGRGTVLVKNAVIRSRDYPRCLFGHDKPKINRYSTRLLS